MTNIEPIAQVIGNPATTDDRAGQLAGDARDDLGLDPAKDETLDGAEVVARALARKAENDAAIAEEARNAALADQAQLDAQAERVVKATKSLLMLRFALGTGFDIYTAAQMRDLDDPTFEVLDALFGPVLVHNLADGKEGSADIALVVIQGDDASIPLVADFDVTNGPEEQLTAVVEGRLCTASVMNLAEAAVRADQLGARIAAIKAAAE